MCHVTWDHVSECSLTKAGQVATSGAACGPVVLERAGGTVVDVGGADVGENR